MSDSSFSDFFEETDQFVETKNNLGGDDLFAILESLDSVTEFLPLTPLDHETACFVSCKESGEEETTRLVSQKSSAPSSEILLLQESETTELEASLKRNKRAKLLVEEGNNNYQDGQQKVSHITVERNRRKQMTEHLSVLRSLMPCFYVKRGDQASIIGGVVDYINELQQILQSLEAKKQRKVYSEVLSPRLVSSQRPSPVPAEVLSPRKPPLSPRLNLPISPRTPQPSSPYKPRQLQQSYLQLSPTTIPSTTTSLEPSPSSSSTNSSSNNDTINELVANSKSAIADVEVKFSGPNLVLKTVSPRIPGQAVKVISALEDLPLEILHVNISTVDKTMMLNSFTIKIGVECQLSAEELAQQIQQTFC